MTISMIKIWDKDICNEIMHGKIRYIERSVKK